MALRSVDKVLWSLPGFFSTSEKAGLLFSPERTRCTLLDNPPMWWGRTIQEIYDLRRELVWGTLPPWSALPKRLHGDYLKIPVSSSPLKVACTFQRELRPVSHFRRLPVGGHIGRLADLRIIDDYAPDRSIETVISRRDSGASEDIIALSEAGMDVYRISELLSAGLLGSQERKRIIPTKSAIVVVDKTVSDHFLSRVIDFPTVDCFEVYYSRYLDTTYAVLVMPGRWEHEQVRTVYSSEGWRVESQSETFKEKPVFPGQIGGSYFAGRFAVAGGLHRRRRQGRALLFREILDRNTIAVGAWQVRESLRHAFEEDPQCYERLEDAIADVSNSLKMPSQLWRQNSRLLSRPGRQTTLH